MTQDVTGRSKSTMKILDYLSPQVPTKKQSKVAVEGGQLGQEGELDEDFLNSLAQTEDEEPLGGPPGEVDPPVDMAAGGAAGRPQLRPSPLVAATQGGIPTPPPEDDDEVQPPVDMGARARRGVTAGV